jgi:predicted Zn-dependent protease
MKPLEPPDSRYLEAAQGWLELGNHVEAGEELDRIEAGNRGHPMVLQVRWRIEAKAEHWDTCLEIATALTEIAPDRRFGWLHLAMSLRKLNRIAEARDVLMKIVDKFEPNSTLPYYLACYCAQLGQINEAKGWFTLTLANATTDQERDRIKGRASNDQELQPIWDSLSEL